MKKYSRPCAPHCFPYCSESCYPAPAPAPNCTNQTTNKTVPEIPAPSGNVTPPAPVVVTNCSFFKVCRERPTCQDQAWWDYWNQDYSSSCGTIQCGDCCNKQCHPSCEPCGGCQPKKMRKRVCNATEDESFNLTTFKQNVTYYDGCDCVVFTNCTNTTIYPNETTPIIPVPPIPSGGEACNYTCDDIRQLHILIQNMSVII